MQIKVREPTWLPINAYTYLRSTPIEDANESVEFRIPGCDEESSILGPRGCPSNILGPGCIKTIAKLPNAYPRTKMSQEGCIWFQMPKGPSEQHLQRSKTGETNIGVTWCLRFLQFFVSRYPLTTRASGFLSEGILIWLVLLTSLPGNSANLCALFGMVKKWPLQRWIVISNVWEWKGHELKQPVDELPMKCAIHSHKPTPVPDRQCIHPQLQEPGSYQSCSKLHYLDFSEMVPVGIEGSTANPRLI